MKQLFCAIFCCLWCYVSSQETKSTIVSDNEPIEDVLEQLESTFSINFSYLDTLLEDVTINLLTDTTDTLDNYLRHLQSQTGLKFEKANNANVIIRAFTTKDLLDGCGYVKGYNDKPIRAIKILINGNVTNYTTDKEGYFSLKDIPYGIPITLVTTGSYPHVFNSKIFVDESCSIFKIQSKDKVTQVLDEVIIQDYIGKGIKKKKNFISLKTKDLDILPGLVEPDILQSIQLTPGVNSPFETATGLYVRGSTPNQNLVLWNGIKTYNQGHLFGVLSAFNPYIVEETNFYKSGVNARYGDRVSGVIDIQTADEVATEFHGGAGINMLNADGYVSVPLLKDRLSIQVSGRRSYTDNLQTPTYDQYATRVFQNTKIIDTPVNQDIQENDFYFGDYNMNLVGQLSERNKIQLNAIYSKNNLAFKTGGETANFADLLRTENEGYHFEWFYGGDKLTVEAASYYTKYLLDYQFVTVNPVVTQQTEEKKNSIRDYGASIVTSYNFNDKARLDMGYQFSKNNIRYAFETITPSFELTLDQDDSTLDTHSLYSEFEYNAPGNINVTLGIRANSYTEIARETIEPRLFLKKNITPSFSLNLTGEYRSQPVSQIQESVVSDLALENVVWTLANTDDTPLITSHQYSFGSTFKKKSWLIDLDSYYKEITDITTLTAGFLAPINNGVQLGESRIYGLDVFFKKDFGKYNSWISYAYINAQNTFEELNEGVSFRSNTNIEHTVRWSHFYTINNLKFTLGWLWHSGKSFTELIGVATDEPFIELQYDELNGGNLPVYHRLDFSMLYNFHIGRREDISYRIGASVLNVYNRKNLIGKEFRTTNTLNNQFIQNEFTSLGITPNISFRVFW